MVEENKIIKLNVINTLNEMEKLKVEWKRVFHNSSYTPFQSWEWNYHLAKTYTSSDSLRILVGSNNEGKIIGIAPLKLKKYTIPWMKVLEFIGTGPSDYLDIIIEKEYSDIFLEEMFNWIKNNKEWRIINFVSLRKEIIEIYIKYFQMEFSNDIVCPYIDLPASFEEYKKNLSKDFYNYLRKNLTRLKSEKRIEYSTLESSQDLVIDLNIFMNLHQKRQKTKGERGRFYSSTWSKQFQELSISLFEAGMLKLGVLKIDSKFASLHFNLIFQDKEYAYLLSMNPEFAKLSPGSLLFYLMIEDSIKNGMKIFDFTRGSEPYKYKWTKKEAQLHKAFASRTILDTFFWNASERIKYIIYHSKLVKKIYLSTIGKIKS